MIKKLLGIDSWENKIWNRAYDIGYTSAEVDNATKNKEAYDEGYAEGYKKGQEYIRKNNVVLQKADLDNLVSVMGKKRWSRKGCCPRCNVHTGSNHNKDCKLLTTN